MKKEEWLYKRIEKLVGSDFDSLEKNVIIADEEGYHVFGKYTITKINNVQFRVNKENRISKNFSTLRYALSWCIADKFGNSKLANNIQHLDEEKIRISDDVSVRQAMLDKMQDPERKEITKVKLISRKQGLKLVENRLAKCVSLAKYCQIRGFNSDETARTRRT